MVRYRSCYNDNWIKWNQWCICLIVFAEVKDGCFINVTQSVILEALICKCTGCVPVSVRIYLSFINLIALPSAPECANYCRGVSVCSCIYICMYYACASIYVCLNCVCASPKLGGFQIKSREESEHSIGSTELFIMILLKLFLTCAKTVTKIMEVPNIKNHEEVRCASFFNNWTHVCCLVHNQTQGINIQ